MERPGIDLKNLVMKASKVGVELTMGFEDRGRMVLRAYRNGFTINCCVSLLEINTKMWQQGEQFERMVDDLIYRLNEAEQKLIETGGYEQ